MRFGRWRGVLRERPAAVQFARDRLTLTMAEPSDAEDSYGGEPLWCAEGCSGHRVARPSTWMRRPTSILKPKLLPASRPNWSRCSVA